MPVPGTLSVSVVSLPQRRDGKTPELSNKELAANNLDVMNAEVWPQRQSAMAQRSYCADSQQSAMMIFRLRGPSEATGIL
jgi:hypothetical protein